MGVVTAPRHLVWGGSNETVDAQGGGLTLAGRLARVRQSSTTFYLGPVDQADIQHLFCTCDPWPQSRQLGQNEDHDRCGFCLPKLQHAGDEITRQTVRRVLRFSLGTQGRDSSLRSTWPRGAVKEDRVFKGQEQLLFTYRT